MDKVIPLWIVLIASLNLSSPAWAASGDEPGASIYVKSCAPCHGPEGRGDGPKAKAFNLKSPDLKGPAFWGPDAKKRSLAAIADGYKTMPALDLTPEEAQAVTDYMARNFSK